MALMLVLAVVPSVPAETVRCPRCADVGQVLAPIAAASYDARFDPALDGIDQALARTPFTARTRVSA